MDEFPLISIGVPLYNAEATISNTLNSLIVQDYPNIEILISNNASTDNSLSICEEFAQLSDRISIISQPENIGPIRNFEYVLKESMGVYFIWCASDDYLSPNAISENFELLVTNSTAVGCSSIHAFEGQVNRKIGHELKGNLSSRVKLFFTLRRELHGNFYCLFERRLLLGCPFLSKSFIGWDWAIVFYLILKGDLIRSKYSEALFGMNGMSRRSKDLNSVLGISSFWFFFPYLTFSFFILKLMEDIPSLRLKIFIFLKLLTLNIFATIGRLKGKILEYRNSA